ncbi:TBC1 domain family member 30-like isoform X2 [Microplitis demolitor]|uniref:TBC1 domain family member 30-like isoform X2 n=1 Tax=Microplitis demolitor TaxID=69319 RepID=UPI00235B639C|nr:TBC1 domain family member 30-like isoform X2 [Microplitis demolitor]
MSAFFNSLKSLATGATHVAGTTKYGEASNHEGGDVKVDINIAPQPSDNGFAQWLDAMKMVARSSEGIPHEFRKKLWLILADRHLEQRGIDWKKAEKLCFNEWTSPDDEKLGVQIVKDLHRTGCSLFCGAAARDNQMVLRRVLLGYARWNKSVGYCQGLNVLAALILQVTDRTEVSAVKVLIYLIEGVLPEDYFAENLRGLSVDMAVFRDLLRIKLPKLSKHLESLQNNIKNNTKGSSYEPPLINVFTMQWFLTLFCHCLPQHTVLRVWDLIFLEGNEILLKTALAIWEGISDRIITVTSTDEFYCIMGVLTREMLEFTDTNILIKWHV